MAPPGSVQVVNRTAGQTLTDAMAGERAETAGPAVADPFWALIGRPWDEMADEDLRRRRHWRLGDTDGEGDGDACNVPVPDDDSGTDL
eukprot:5288154-Lingulodinium_polyedra.AAC.1